MLCSLCRTSDILCQACQRHADSGEISKPELAFFRELAKLAETGKPDTNSVTRVFDRPEALIIFCRPQELSALIGRGGKNIHAFSAAVKKPVQLVPDTTDRDQFLKALLHPVPIMATAVVYIRGGQSLRITVSRRPLPVRPETVQMLAKTILGVELEIVRQSAT